MSIPDSNTSLLNLFPTIKIDGQYFLDFWNSYKITDEFKLLAQEVDYYQIGHGERWDLIAQYIYGDRDLWWVIVLFNDIEDPFSLYFDLDVRKSIKKIKVLKQKNLYFLLNTVRERILKLENDRLKSEAINDKKQKINIL
jgi:hypothetical protein